MLHLGAGKFVIVLDNESRENEGDIILAGCHVTPEKMGFMIRYTGWVNKIHFKLRLKKQIKYCSGFICCATTEERLKQLELPIMVPNSSDHIRACYCITTDFKEGKISFKWNFIPYFIDTTCLETTTGISASDRAKTANALADFTITDPNKFYKPGHMVTLQAEDGGVLKRGGHTEATIGEWCLFDRNLTPLSPNFLFLLQIYVS